MGITLHFVSPLSYIQLGVGVKIQLLENSTGGTCNSTGGKDPSKNLGTYHRIEGTIENLSPCTLA